MNDGGKYTVLLWGSQSHQKFINIYQVSRVRQLLFLCFVFFCVCVLQSGKVASFNKDSRFNNN